MAAGALVRGGMGDVTFIGQPRRSGNQRKSHELRKRLGKPVWRELFLTGVVRQQQPASSQRNHNHAATALKTAPMINHARACGTSAPACTKRQPAKQRNTGPKTAKTSLGSKAGITRPSAPAAAAAARRARLC